MTVVEVRPKRVCRMLGFRDWRWRLDQVYVKLNDKMVYLRGDVDQEREVLLSFVTETRDKQAALTIMKKASMFDHLAEGAELPDGRRSYVPPSPTGPVHNSFTAVWWPLEYLPEIQNGRDFRSGPITRIYLPRGEPRMIENGAFLHHSANQ